MCDYQESVTTGQTHRRMDGQTDTGQSDPYVPLCFAGDTKTYTSSIQTIHPFFVFNIFLLVRGKMIVFNDMPA